MFKKKPGPEPLFSLFKPGIVYLVAFTGAVGYLLSWSVDSEFNWLRFVLFLLGLSILSGGSFAINQAQENTIDAKMERTQRRPIPTGKISPRGAYVLGFLALGIGLGILRNISLLAAILGFGTAIFYNVLYTIYWKRKWAFGAVPGAIPGAMPVVIGYAANSNNLLNLDCLYMFLLMFLWQMPHFWALAIRFKDDYKKGGIPVLPSVRGVDATLFHMSLYVYVYVGLALLSPAFIETSYLYYILVIPFALKVLQEFFKYFKHKAEVGWFRFFMWVNTSLLIFMAAPVFEKWVFRLVGVGI